MAKRKIRFIKPWGNYKVGDTIDNPSEVTVRTLCFRHRFAELVGDPALQARIEKESKTLRDLQQDFQFELEAKKLKSEIKVPPLPSPTEKTEVDQDIEQTIKDVKPTKEKEPPGAEEARAITGEKKKKKRSSRKKVKSRKKRDPGDLTDEG